MTPEREREVARICEAVLDWPEAVRRVQHRHCWS